MTLEELPVYVYCAMPDCNNKHFLSLNRDVQGGWVIGYVEFENGGALAELAINNSSTVKEAVQRMAFALERWNKKS